MPDSALLLRDTDRDDLIRDTAAAVVAAIRPHLPTTALLVDGDGLASLLGVSRQTIDLMRSAGTIPSVTLGRRRLYRPDAVIAALSANEKGAADA